MKKLSFYILFAMLSIKVVQASPNQTITLAVDDYCPYYCKDPHSSTDTFAKKPGYIIEIINLAFSQKGYSLKYLFYPWERSLTELHKNNVNAIVVSAKKDAPSLIYPKNEQGLSRGCFIKETGDPWQFINRDSLDKIRLGVVKGYQYGEPVDSFLWQYHEPEYQVTEITGPNNLSRLLLMMKKKRLDVVIDDRNVLEHTIKLLNLEDSLSFAGCTDHLLKLYVAFSPKNPHSEKYAEIMSNAIQSMRESGQLEVILKKYGLNDWQ